MKMFSFMRKPTKLILYGILLALLCTVGLIFFLQYRVDKGTIDMWTENYAYVGTVVPDVEISALLTELPEEAQTILKNSEDIESLHTVKTSAAKILSGKYILDTMMTDTSLDQHFFVEAVITGYYDWSQWGSSIKYERYNLELVKEWGGDKVNTERGFAVMLTRFEDDEKWEIGQKIFFISGYINDGNGILTNEFDIMTPTVYELMYGSAPTNVFYANPFFLMDEDDGDDEIINFMDEAGILPYYEKYAELGGNIAVRAIDDFYALTQTAENRVYVTDGRALTASDYGKNVCMISQNLSLRNRYRIGDTITLSIAEDSYSYNGWENGNPMPEDELITSYGEEEEYEIIGIYNQISRVRNDPTFFSHTDVFIPGSEFSAEEELPLPYAFSFKVPGTSYDSFEENTVSALEAAGCTVILKDNGWQDVEESYYSMQTRSKLMLVCSIFAFAAAAAAFSVLLFSHLKKEYGLMRLLGAYRHEAMRLYFAAVTAIALPALALSGIVGWVFVNNRLPADGAIEINILAPAIVLPLVLLAVIVLALLLMVRASERGSLRKLIL